MWRSVSAISRNSLLGKLSRGLNFPLQSQVLHLKPAIQAAFLSQTRPHINIHQNHRFFSQDSLNPGVNDTEMSQVSSVVSVEDSEADVYSNADNVFDEMTSSHEEPVSDVSSTIDERGEFVTRVGLDMDINESDGVTEEIDNEKLEHVLSLLQSSKIDDGSLQSSLESDMSAELLEKFVLRVIESPLIPGENLIGFVKLVLEKDKLVVTTPVLELLVRVICNECKGTSAYALWDLLKELGEDGLLTTEILNGLLSLHSVLGEEKACFEMFNKFEVFNCVPNEMTFYFTIEALCRRSNFPLAVSVCETMVDVGKLPDSKKVSNIISYLCKGQKAKEAHAVYLCAKNQDIVLPKSSFNCLISSLCREDSNVHIALEMLDEISKEKRKYAINLFSLVIEGLCRINDNEKAKILLSDMIESGPPPGNSVFNSIINSLSKAGEMMEARKIMKVMESRGLKPDVYTYNVIISGYAKGGEMEEARKVLAEAKLKHSKLTPGTYHTLIRGYCELERFDEALDMLSEMKQYGLQPTANEYQKLIKSLCLKALDWKTAEKLLEEMENNGLYLNEITRGLIQAVKELEEEEVETEDAGIEVQANVS